MDTATIAIIGAVATIMSGVVAGGCAIFAALRAVRTGLTELEAQEIRRQKVECIVGLYGLRFVIGDGQVPTDEERSRLMFEMNKIGALYSDDAEVQRNLRDFFQSRTNGRLIRLLRTMAQTTKLPVDALSDADIANVFLMQRSAVWPSGQVRVGGITINT